MFVARRCTFCNRDISFGEGVMLVKNDGTVDHYCSSKCRKNSLVLRRDPRKFKWVKKQAKSEAKK